MVIVNSYFDITRGYLPLAIRRSSSCRATDRSAPAGCQGWQNARLPRASATAAAQSIAWGAGIAPWDPTWGHHGQTVDPEIDSKSMVNMVIFHSYLWVRNCPIQNGDFSMVPECSRQVWWKMSGVACHNLQETPITWSVGRGRLSLVSEQSHIWHILYPEKLAMDRSQTLKESKWICFFCRIQLSNGILFFFVPCFGIVSFFPK